MGKWTITGGNSERGKQQRGRIFMRVGGRREKFLIKWVESNLGEEFPKWQDFICRWNDLRKWDWFDRGKTSLGKSTINVQQEKKNKWTGGNSESSRVEMLRRFLTESSAEWSREEECFGLQAKGFERNNSVFFFNSFLPAIFLDVSMNFVIDFFFLILLLAYL